MSWPDAPFSFMCGEPQLSHSSQSTPAVSTYEASGREDMVVELLTALRAEFDRLRSEKEMLAREFELFRMRSWVPSFPWQGGSKSSFARPADAEPSRSAAMPDIDIECQELPHAGIQLQGDTDECGEDEKALTAEVVAYARRNPTITLDKQQTDSFEDAVMATKSLPSATEDHYEKLYELTRAFHLLCAPHKATIGDQELAHMKLNQVGCDEVENMSGELRPRYAAAIKAVNKELGIVVSMSSEMQPAKAISLDTFVAIMQQKDVKSATFLTDADDDILEAISEIRDILVREDSLRKIAKATNMSHVDIYQSSRKRRRPTKIQRCLRYLDPFIGVVIILNAIVIGVSTDFMQGSDVWEVCEIAFTAIFTLEIFIKLCSQGIGIFCCGPERYWNLFDTLVVTTAIFDAVFTRLGTLVDLRNFTMIRLLRFARLTKLVRVLKLKAFKELALLVNGIVAGFRTLAWAIVFLAFLLFALGVMLTQMLGQMGEDYWEAACLGWEGTDFEVTCNRGAEHLQAHRKELFGDVTRSMFTVFRCFTDGCSSVDGTPLMPYVYSTHGVVSALLYMIVMLFVIFGLFNLIMAVFVENTIENAKYDDGRRREAREQEALRVAKKLQNIIILFCTGGAGMEGENDEEVHHRSKGHMWSVWNLFSTTSAGPGFRDLTDDFNLPVSNLSIHVTHSAFDKMLQRPEVHEMLDGLDIGGNNRQTLFEVLDANGNGTLDVSELVQGLLKLRGTADKGDLVAALLAIRSLQKGIKAIELLSLHQQAVIDDIKYAQESMHSTLQELQGPRLKQRGSTVSIESPEGQSERLVSPRPTSPPTPGLSQMRADVERRVTRISTGSDRLSNFPSALSMRP